MPRYNMDFSQYKKIQKMSKNEFSRWINDFGKNICYEGYTDATNDVEPGMTETEESIKVIFDEEELYKVLTSVKGVSGRIANNIMDAMMCWYDKNRPAEGPEMPQN